MTPRMNIFRAARDADYEQHEARFNDKQIAHLTVAVAAINVWDQVQIGLCAVHPVEAAAPSA